MRDSSLQRHGTSRSKQAARKGKLRSRILLCASSLFVAFILAEVTLRALGIAFPRTTQPDFFRASSFIPGAEWVQTSEGRSYVVINSEGFNDCERSQQKPPGCFRIAVLGDSYVAALQLERERRFTEILEKELNQRKCFSPKNVEVLNFGVSDYGTLQELMVLRQQVWQYDPDMIILAVFPENDLDDNCQQLAYHPHRPFGVVQDGQLELDYSFRSSQNRQWWKLRLIDPCVDASRVMHLVRRAQYVFRNKKTNVAILSLMDLVERPQSTNIYYESDDEARRQSWKITDDLISLVNQEVTGQGAKFFVVVLGTHLQVTPSMSVRTKLLEFTGTDTLFYPGNRIKAIGQREGFSVLDLAPSFQEFADKHQVYLHASIKKNNRVTPFGHWNEQGHQLAAGLIADELCKRQKDEDN